MLSPVAYNRRVGPAFLRPVTNQVKGDPFEILIPGGLPVGGGILSDASSLVHKVLGKLRTLRQSER